MASHAGLVLILKTRDGYVGNKGEIVKDKYQAHKISFYEAGFRSAIEIYEKLGFNQENLKENDIYLEALIPSFEARVGRIESLYRELGKNYQQALSSAEFSWRMFGLDDYEKYTQFVQSLQQKVIEEHKNKEVADTVYVHGNLVNLKNVNGSEEIEEGELKKIYFYSDTEKVCRFSINLKKPNVEKYFNLNQEEQNYYNNWQNEGLEDFLQKEIMNNLFECQLGDNFKILGIEIKNNNLCIYTNEGGHYLPNFIKEKIREYYNMREMHITRMFGSYIILQRINRELKAVKATPVPIKYCPLMVKLLKEIDEVRSEILIEAIKNSDSDIQTKMICELINEVVIKGGYFDTSRPLNSCEANVLFGASETISSAFKSDMLDAAVIVSNNLGTIITTNESNTQGAVKRMTGLFYTSPNEDIVTTALKAQIIPVFPYTARIDQIEGVKTAIKRGYKKIAVTVAANDNYLLKEINKLQTRDITIYKFGLCSTGIDKGTAKIMLENADIVWACASKYVKEYIEPNAIAQVGVKIPVHILTQKGWELVQNHLQMMSGKDIEANLVKGEEKPVVLNQGQSLKLIKKREVHNCNDCPHPCI